MPYPQFGAYVPGMNPAVTQSPFIGPTISPSATSPAKNTYVQNKANQIAQTPAVSTTPDNNIAANNAANNAYFAQNPNIFGSQSSQPQTPTTPSPTGMNGYSGGLGSTQGVYDPYQSPAYQQYIKQAVAAAQPGMSNPDIQKGLVQANTDLSGLQQISSNNIAYDLQNPNLSQGALTGQTAAEAAVLANRTLPIQTRINLLQQQQGQAQTAAGIPLAAGNLNAAYLGGLATPTPISSGQNLTQLNPATGQLNNLGGLPSYSAISNPLSPSGITTYNQQTGQQNSGFGSTPPTLGGNTQSDLAAQYMQNPIIAGYVQSALNSNGDLSQVPPQYQAAVNTVLQAQSSGQYSPGNAGINQTNLAAQQAQAQVLKPFLDTATSHLADLQSLANDVNYSNSPIASDVRNKFSNSILTDPKITTLQSAIGVVREEVAKVLGGGTATDSARADATAALPANLSPQNIATVIANVTKLMNDKLATYSDPTKSVKLSTGLQMPPGYAASIPAGALTITIP